MAEKKKLGKYESIYQKYMAKMSSLFSSHACADVYEQIKAGKSKYLKYERVESSSFDMEWIKEIEDAIFDLGEIIKNPKKTTKTEETIVPAELARKTNATSVRHLASHTQFIKEIDERGNVTPSKILNIGAEDDYATYENRFVATLIRRLVLFIEKRYEYINEFAELKDAEVLMVKNKSIVDGKEVEIETKVRILSDNDATGAGQSSSYIQRIKEVRRYIRFYYNSPFMKILKNERDVRNPILQTNIIRKNPLYRRAYKLYKFIETYDTLGVNFKINEKYSDFSEKEMEEINATLLANFLMVKGKDPEKGALKNITKQYKPRVLTSMDDEEFVYSDLLKGPIEFVRIDDAYTSYLETPIPNVPDKPKKEEKEFYEEELRKKEEKKSLLKAQKALLARKKKEQKEWDKKAEKLVQARLKAEAEERRRQQEAIRKAEEARIAAAREELKQDAKEQKLEIKEEAPIEKAPDTFEEALLALTKQAKEDLNNESEEEAKQVEEKSNIEEEANEDSIAVEENQNEEETLNEKPESNEDLEPQDDSEEKIVSDLEQNNQELVSEVRQNDSETEVNEELVDNIEDNNPEEQLDEQEPEKSEQVSEPQEVESGEDEKDINLE